MHHLSSAPPLKSLRGPQLRAEEMRPRSSILKSGRLLACRIEQAFCCGASIMSSMKIIRNIIIVVALSAVALATSACPEKGPAEKAGEKIDKAIDETKDAAKDATK